jgi:hypothetical protein
MVEPGVQSVELQAVDQSGRRPLEFAPFQRGKFIRKFFNGIGLRLAARVQRAPDDTRQTPRVALAALQARGFIFTAGIVQKHFAIVVEFVEDGGEFSQIVRRHNEIKRVALFTHRLTRLRLPDA